MRRAPEVRDHIIQLLTALTSCNNDIWDIASGARQDGSSLAHELEDYDDDLFLDHQPQSEALELALNVADVVTNLMKVSALIRKATTRDRYARAYSENEIPFLTEFDARHVADKFPKTVAHSWLLDRLGKANARRRLYLRYARDHRDRLGEVSLLPFEKAKFLTFGRHVIRLLRLMTVTLKSASSHILPLLFLLYLFLIKATCFPTCAHRWEC